MNKPMLTIGIILLALLGFYSISVITSQQTGAELDYYLLKECTEAAMNDAVDTAYYRNYGMIRMDKEKFMESFVKRFGNAVEGTRDYRVQVYDINETPPKVSIKITSGDKASQGFLNVLNGDNKDTVEITTNADMILESEYKTNIAIANKNKDIARELKITSVNQIK